MHQSAMFYGKKFFEIYCGGEFLSGITIVDVGSQDVNGSLREVAPKNARYIGLDFVEGKGVDIVMDDPYRIPLSSESADVVVTSSCFEHSEFFWLTFIEIARVLKPGGYIYLNVPSNGMYHRYPVDCWRFYPDSGAALASWARRSGFDIRLIESFVGDRSEENIWNDFVAVFKKEKPNALVKQQTGLLFECVGNIFNVRTPSTLVNFSEHSYEFNIINSLIQAEVVRTGQVASLSQTVTELKGQISSLNDSVAERDAQIVNWQRAFNDQGGLIERLHRSVTERDAQIVNWQRAFNDQGGLIERLHRSVTERDAQVTALLSSTSWRMTIGFRWLRRNAGKAAQLFRSITIGRILRCIFRWLPLSMMAKNSIKNAVFRHFAFLLKNRASYRYWQQLNRLENELTAINGEGLAVSRISLDLPPGFRKILVIDATTPTPDRDAGSVTAWFFLKAMVELGFDVTFIPADLKPLGRYTDSLRAFGVRALTSNEIETIEQFLEQKGQEIEIAFLYRVFTAKLILPLIRKHSPEARIIFDTVDLHYLREQRQAELSGDLEKIKAARHTKKAEFEMMRSADVTIVLSRAELEIIKHEDPGINLSVIPLLLDIPGCKKPFSMRSDIVFIGGFFHQPNIDAIKYFVSDIWPTVRRRLPKVSLLIIGSNATEDILALAANDERIKVVGYVEDIAPYFNQCRISIAPLRYGAGIKGKIGTSASYGVPCVATTLAAEGMGLVDGVEVIVADGAAKFAEKVIELYSDENLWVSVSKGSLDFVRRNYSFETGKARLEALIRTLFV